MAKVRTVISVLDMLRAKTDDKVLVNILFKLKPFLLYLSSKIYQDPIIHSDAATSIEDIYSFCQMHVVIAIRNGYRPEKYKKSKDKKSKKNYLDGFSYIESISHRFYNKFKQRYNASKLIPHAHIHPLLFANNDDDEKSFEYVGCNDTVPEVLVEMDNSKNRIDDIIETFRGKRAGKLGKFNLHYMIKAIIESDMTYADLATHYDVSRQYMSEIIKDNITSVLRKLRFDK